MKKKYYFIYKTTFEDGHYYIGQHKTNDINDNYIGSGVKLLQYINDNPNIKYKREILCYCYSIGQLNEKEREYIGELYKTDDLCLNLKEGGWGHTYSEEAKKNISEGVRKALEKDPTIIERIAEKLRGKPSWNKGIKTPIEVRKKQSESHKGIQAGDKHPLYGKSCKDFMTEEQIITWRQNLSKGLKGHKSYEWTDEQRKNMSECHKDKPLSEEHKKNIGNNSRNRQWFNNGEENVFIKPEEIDSYIKNGYTKGKTKTSKTIKNRQMFNNGKKNVFIKPEEIDSYIMNGYTKGKLKKHHNN